ncbi:MAG: beta-lactamase family protein [Chloroflexi bacterium]|nr:beta-lactamase family protein [Chloroflexota bacterium]
MNFGAVREVFQQQYRDKQFWGGQLVVRYQGETVVDEVIGVADRRTQRPVTGETPFLCFSIAKPFTGICIHKLIEAGRLELDAPVADYWPEFGCKGKEKATIRHVFLHQAGIPSRGNYRLMPFWGKWVYLTSTLANLDAQFEPGTRTAYHSLNYGFIFGEVVRRVTGQPFEVYLREQFLDPLKLENTYMGLPPHRGEDAAYAYCKPIRQKRVAWTFRIPAMRRAVVPAAGLNSTARDIARFFQMLVNGGSLDGRQYLKAETVAQTTSLGNDDPRNRWGYGFVIGGLNKPDFPVGNGMGAASSVTSFGHFGQTVRWHGPTQRIILLSL